MNAAVRLPRRTRCPGAPFVCRTRHRPGRRRTPWNQCPGHAFCASVPELLPAGTRLTVHVIDPIAPGPGRVWRTEQSAELLMNTVASQVTLFTDASVDCAGPIRPGPSLYEVGGRRAGPGRLSDPRPLRAVSGVGVRPDRPHRPGGGARRGPPGPGRTGCADQADGRQLLTLDDGRTLPGLAAVVLAQGHLPAAPDAEQLRTAAYAARHGLCHIPPRQPGRRRPLRGPARRAGCCCAAWASTSSITWPC